MSIATEIIRNDYVADGLIATFPFEFIIYDQDNLDVYVDGVIQTVDIHFTIADEWIENDAGGEIVFGIAHIPADEAKVALLSGAPYTQDTVLASRDETYEETYDKAVILIKQLREVVGRALQFSTTSTQSGITLPEPLAEYHLRWKDDLTALENIFVPTFPEPVAGYYLRWKTDLSGLENVRYEPLGVPFQLTDIYCEISLGILTVTDGPAHYIVDIGGESGAILTEGGVEILTEGGVEILTEGSEEIDDIVERVIGPGPGEVFSLSCRDDARPITVQAGAYLVLSRGLRCVLETTKYEMLFRMGQGGVAHELSRSANQTA